jgi:UDP-N-acetylmuramate--alanine ligase
MSREKYHFIGIGGAGMSALARIMAARGETIGGSEMADSDTRRALEHELEISIPVGHDARNLGDATFVVASAAIKQSNSEIVAAKEKGIPVKDRAEMLGVVMDLYPERIAVSGTHGKTTTSAMVARMLEDAGLDPSALIGGEVPAWKSNARAGKGDIVVAEACEAFGSFLQLHPTISIVTNVEADHLDYYHSFDNIIEAFRKFLAGTTRLAVLSADDPSTDLIIGAVRTHVTTVGLSHESQS